MGRIVGSARSSLALDNLYLILVWIRHEEKPHCDAAFGLKLLQDEPEFAETFITHILERTIRVEADLVDQLFNSSEKRLARALLLLANFGKDEEPEKKIIEISQEALAEMIGTPRSRVSFFMNKFRKLGFIDYNGGIRIHSSLLNVVLNDQPHIVRDQLEGES